MSEPCNPEPIRLRRRLLAGGTAVGSLVMTVWALGAMIGNAQTAPHIHRSADEQAAPTQSASANPVNPSESSGAAGPALAHPLLASAPASDSSSASAPSSLSRGKPLPECTNGQLDVAAAPYQGDYRAGETPRFQLAVSNVSGRECYADFSSGQRGLRMLGTGGRTVWSTSDSAIGGPMEVHRLSPGQAISVDVDGPAAVPHGRYAVVGEFGTRSTAPHLFSVH